MKPTLTKMTRLGGAMLLALTSNLAAHADYQSTVLSQNPVGYWRLSETTPANPLITTATNLGSVSGDGTYEGPQGFFRGFPGVIPGNSAAQLDGSDQFIDFPSDSTLTPGVFSVEAWLSADQVAANCALSCGIFTSPRSGWLIYQDADTGYNFRLYHGTDTSTTVNIYGETDNVVGVYTHVVATFDGTTAKLYLNGELAASGTPTAGKPYLPGATGTMFTIGARGGLQDFNWAGKADEVAYYNAVLTPEVIAAHYAAATTNAAGYATQILADNPMLYFRLAEPGDPSTTTFGSYSNMVQAAFSPGTTPGVAGPRPPDFTGLETTNHAVGVSGGSSVAVSALNLNTNAVTISGWVKASGSQDVAAGLVVCDGGSTYAGLTMDALSGGLGLGYVWNNDPNTYNVSLSGDLGLPALNDGEWAYVALVIQPTEADIYISSPTIPFTSVTNYYPNPIQAFDGNTLFGSDANTYNFNGDIDEVGIWNTSLSAGQLYTQYGSAVGGLEPKIFVDLQAPPGITYVGDTLNLSADIGGTPDLSYQWYNTSGAISGATGSVYTKINAQASDSSTYYVVVTNLYGNVTSAGAVVSVVPPFNPVVVTPPVGETIYPGGTVNLSVDANGGGLGYQWSKDSVPIDGATSSNYVVAVATSNDAGSYTVSITNSVGSADAGPATVTVLTPANEYETLVVDDTPEAWYRMDETSGTNLVDSMGRHPGIYMNDSGSPVTFGAAGAIQGSSDTAVTFNGPGSLSYGLVPYSPMLNQRQWAIEAWVKTENTTYDNMTAVSSHSDALTGYGIWETPAGSWSALYSSGGTDYYASTDVAAAGVVPGQWTHIVMSYDTTFQIYINGQWDGGGYAGFDLNTSAPFLIGAFGGPAQLPFDGEVDEVAVYAHPLSLAEAQAHYNAGAFPNPTPAYFLNVPASDQVMSNANQATVFYGLASGSIPITYQWFFNGVPILSETNITLTVSDTQPNAGSYMLQASNLYGTTNSPVATLAVLSGTPSYVNVTNGLVVHLTFDGNYQDSSGRANNGTATGFNGGLPSIVSGRLGSGAVHYNTDTSTGIPFNADTNAVVTDSSYVTLGNPADLQFGTATDFSASFWVKLPVGYVNGDLPFLCSAVGSSYNPGLTFAPAYTNGGWAFTYNGVGLQGPANSINDGNWHLLVYSVNRMGNANTYLDGVQVDSRLASAIGNMNSGEPFSIGQDPTGKYPEQGTATIDDLAIWRRALTSYEAYSIYYAATTSDSSFNVPGTVTLNISQVGTNVELSWNPGATLGTLEEADNIAGPWTSVGAYVPSYQVPPTASQKFYRLNISE